MSSVSCALDPLPVIFLLTFKNNISLFVNMSDLANQIHSNIEAIINELRKSPQILQDFAYFLYNCHNVRLSFPKNIAKIGLAASEEEPAEQLDIQIYGHYTKRAFFLEFLYKSDPSAILNTLPIEITESDTHEQENYKLVSVQSMEDKIKYVFQKDVERVNVFIRYDPLGDPPYFSDIGDPSMGIYVLPSFLELAVAFGNYLVT